MRISFIGLGVMGYPMAGHLVKAGHRVTVFNRSRAKALAWCQEYPDGRQADSLAQAAESADVIITCIGGDQDLRQIAYGGEGIIANARSGSVWVDHTSASAEVAQELYAAGQTKGLGFIDAPVSGGQSGAESGSLTVMAGGDALDFERIQEFISAYAKRVSLLGASGAGQLTKMVNQICLAGLIQSLSEGVNFAQAAGLDADKVIAAIQHGAAQSWQMDNRAQTMSEDEFNFGFAVDLMRKDLGICLSEANKVGASLPVTALVDQFYARIQQQGGNRYDTSALIKLLR